MKFNERLMALRKKRGLSQEELGFELGVSRQTVSKWESGQSYPDFQRLVLLADYLDISLDELVRGLDVGDVRALNESEKQRPRCTPYRQLECGPIVRLNKTRASPSGTGPCKASKALTCTIIVTGSHGFVNESGEKAEIRHESVLVAVSAAGVI